MLRNTDGYQAVLRCVLAGFWLLISASVVADDGGMSDLKTLAESQPCSDVMSAVSDRDTIARVIVVAGLMTDNQAIGELLGQGEDELALFVEDVFRFCKVIPAYSFKQITDRVL